MDDPIPTHEKFRQARDRADISQAELARRLKPYGISVSPSTITKWEAGERGISMEVAMRLCDVLGVKWEDLYLPTQNSDIDPAVLEVRTFANQIETVAGQVGLMVHMMEQWPERLGKLSEDESNGIPPEIRGDLDKLSYRVADIWETLERADEGAISVHGQLSRVMKRLDGSA